MSSPGPYGGPPATPAGWHARPPTLLLPPPAPVEPEGPHGGRAVFPLRPLAVGEVLDAAVTTIRAYPRATLGPAAVLYGSMLGLVLAFGGLLTALVYGTDNPLAKTLAAVVAAVGVVGVQALGGAVQLGVIALFSTLMAGVVTRAVLGRAAPVRAVWRDTKRSFWWLLLYALMLQVAAVVPLTLLVLVAFVAGVRDVGPYLYLAGVLVLAVVTMFFYAQVWLAPTAVVVERVHVMRGIARAWQVNAGGRWRATGIVALTMLICLLLWAAISVGLGAVTSLVTYLLSIALSPGTLGTITLVSTFLGALLIGAVATPFLAVVASVAYVDQRSRSEGLDLRVDEARAIGWLPGPLVRR